MESLILAGGGLEDRRRSSARMASRPSTRLPSSSIISASSVNVAASALASPALYALTNASSLPRTAASSSARARGRARGRGADAVGGVDAVVRVAAAVARSRAVRARVSLMGVAYPLACGLTGRSVLGPWSDSPAPHYGRPGGNRGPWERTKCTEKAETVRRFEILVAPRASNSSSGLSPVLGDDRRRPHSATRLESGLSTSRGRPDRHRGSTRRPSSESRRSRPAGSTRKEQAPCPTPKSRPAILHVHGPRFPHDAVEIFGNTAGLERLINALIDAVNVGRGRCEFMVRDGFEAEARVACLDGPRRDEDWRRSGSPYLDVDDPLVARVVELTEENARLRNTLPCSRGKPRAGP